MSIIQLPLKIAMTFERRSEYMARGYSYEDCAELPDAEIDNIYEALCKLGHDVEMVGDIKALVERLAHDPAPGWDLVFNTSEGWRGRAAARESRVPALLEAFGINFTFSDSATLAQAHDKTIAKAYRSPSSKDPAQSAITASPHSTALANFPVFVKPAAEGSSKGISKINKITTASELEPVVKILRERFPEQEILIESFLSGNDVTISILGTGADARVIGIREFVYGSHTRDAAEDFLSFERKMTSRELWPYYRDTEIDMKGPLTAKACETALAAYRALGCRDLARVDVRFDCQGQDGKPYVMEVCSADLYTKGPGS
ncbi:hypothetical protein FRB97_003409 [Tulasnella sp. 331]|nr:hypothetical protein FRB97_003409 [Tulasnella sp. 331]